MVAHGERLGWFRLVKPAVDLRDFLGEDFGGLDVGEVLLEGEVFLAAELVEFAAVGEETKGTVGRGHVNAEQRVLPQPVQLEQLLQVELHFEGQQCFVEANEESGNPSVKSFDLHDRLCDLHSLKFVDLVVQVSDLMVHVLYRLVEDFRAGRRIEFIKPEVVRK